MSLRSRNFADSCVRPASPSSSSSNSDHPGGFTQEHTAIPRPRPPPQLRLPFDDRKRESRLVSDEDFDEIMTQVATTPVTSVSEPTRVKRSVSTSTAATRKKVLQQRKRWSMLGPPPIKHESSGIVPSSPSLKREPESFTALPRPPTKNNMAIYPDDTPVNKFGTPSKADSLLGRNQCISTPATYDTTGRHKRSFSTSAASIVSTVKRRFTAHKEPNFNVRASETGSPLTLTPSQSLGVLPNTLSSPAAPTTNSYSNRLQTIENFMHLNPFHRRLKHQIHKRTPTRTYLNTVIAADKQQITDLALQNSMMVDNINEVRKDWISAEEKLEQERHKSFVLECEVYKLKCQVEELRTERRRQMNA